MSARKFSPTTTPEDPASAKSKAASAFTRSIPELSAYRTTIAKAIRVALDSSPGEERRAALDLLRKAGTGEVSKVFTELMKAKEVGVKSFPAFFALVRELVSTDGREEMPAAPKPEPVPAPRSARPVKTRGSDEALREKLAGIGLCEETIRNILANSGPKTAERVDLLVQEFGNDTAKQILEANYKRIYYPQSSFDNLVKRLKNGEPVAKPDWRAALQDLLTDIGMDGLIVNKIMGFKSNMGPRVLRRVELLINELGKEVTREELTNNFKVLIYPEDGFVNFVSRMKRDHPSLPGSEEIAAPQPEAVPELPLEGEQDIQEETAAGIRDVEHPISVSEPEQSLPQPPKTFEERDREAQNMIIEILKKKFSQVNEKEAERWAKDFFSNALSCASQYHKDHEEKFPGTPLAEIILDRVQSALISLEKTMKPEDLVYILRSEKSYFGLGSSREFSWHIDRRLNDIINSGVTKELWETLFDIGVCQSVRIEIFSHIRSDRGSYNIIKRRALRLKEFGNEAAAGVLNEIGSDVTDDDVFGEKLKALKLTILLPETEQTSAQIPTRQMTAQGEIRKLLRDKLGPACSGDEEVGQIAHQLFSRALTPSLRAQHSDEGVVMEELVLSRLVEFLGAAPPESAKTVILDNAGIFGATEVQYGNFMEEHGKAGSEEKALLTEEDRINDILTKIRVSTRVRTEIMDEVEGLEKSLTMLVLGRIQQLRSKLGDRRAASLVEFLRLGIASDEEIFMGEVQKFDTLREIRSEMTRVGVPPDRVNEIHNMLLVCDFLSFCDASESVRAMLNNTNDVKRLSTKPMRDIFPDFVRRPVVAQPSALQQSLDEPLLEPPVAAKPEQSPEEHRRMLLGQVETGARSLLNGLATDDFIEQLCERPEESLDMIEAAQRSLGAEAKRPQVSMKIVPALKEGDRASFDEDLSQAKTQTIAAALDMARIGLDAREDLARKIASTDASAEDVVERIRELSNEDTGLGPDFHDILGERHDMEEHAYATRLLSDGDFYVEEKINLMMRRKARVENIEEKIAAFFGNQASGAMLLRVDPSFTILNKLRKLEEEFGRDSLKPGVFNGHDVGVLKNNIERLKDIVRSNLDAQKGIKAARVAGLNRLIGLLGQEGAARAEERDENLLNLTGDEFEEAALRQILIETGLEFMLEEFLSFKTSSGVAAGESIGRWKELIGLFGPDAGFGMLDRDPFLLARLASEYQEEVELFRHLDKLSAALETLGVKAKVRKAVVKKCPDPVQALRNVKEISTALEKGAGSFIESKPDLIFAGDIELTEALIDELDGRKEEDASEQKTQGKTRATEKDKKAIQRELAEQWKEKLEDIRSGHRTAIATVMSQRNIPVPEDDHDMQKLVSRHSKRLPKGAEDAVKAMLKKRDNILERLAEVVAYSPGTTRRIQGLGVKPADLTKAICKGFGLRGRSVRSGGGRWDTVERKLRNVGIESEPMKRVFIELGLAKIEDNKSPVTAELLKSPTEPAGKEVLETIRRTYDRLMSGG